ncbi:MAG: hypothetical protein D5R96_02730 [Methanocalculus sp. MSAO_Arc2]|uniref:DUF7288 family protein n=1 Tax=Methanocalculus sp. MSAO_Arc2 TaxID=2293855 RepID=UPI000FEE9B47|nr:MAG: hypothetical protein D5R96_02730 [Methanocalculus sp. MSAO_Arc2]
MVADDSGTLYTIEGVAAALLMIATATIVLQSVSIYTPGDMHIDDMLLEQLGADALAVLDMPAAPGERSDLELIVASFDCVAFHESFYPLLRKRSLIPDDDPVQYSARVFYRDGDEIGSVFFAESIPFTGYEPSIRVTRWIQVHPGHDLLIPYTGRPQAVLFEVVLWRG